LRRQEIKISQTMNYEWLRMLQFCLCLPMMGSRHLSFVCILCWYHRMLKVTMSSAISELNGKEMMSLVRYLGNGWRSMICFLWQVHVQRLHLCWVCRPAIGFQDLKIWKILFVGVASGVSRRAEIYGGIG